MVVIRINKLLIEFVGNKFPRSGGLPWKSNKFHEYFLFNSIEDIENFIKDNNETNCYCSVYYYTEYTQTNRNKFTAVIDTIPFDFDSDDLEISFTDLKIILSWCKRHNIEPRIHFSGGKGWHLYLDIEPINLRNPQQVLAKFGREIKKSAQVESLDQVLFGDLERIIRIPNTKHKTTGRYCIPINPKLIDFLTVDHILKMSETKSTFIPVRKPLNNNSEIHTLLHEYDDIVEVEMEEMKQQIEEIKNKNKNSLFPEITVGIPCPAFHKCMNDPNGVPHHTYNFYVAGCVCKLKSDGFTKDAVFRKVLEMGNRCDPKMNESQIKSVVDYQWDKSWSFCTHFVKVSEQCDNCPNRKF